MDSTATTTDAPRRGRLPRHRGWLLGAGAAVCVLALAFAAWQLVGGSDLQRLGRAADATLAAGSARVAVSATVEGVPVVGPFTLFIAEGELDLRRQRARLRREVPGVSALPLLDRLVPEPVQLLHDGAVTYVRLPVEGERVWVRLAGDEAANGPAAPGPGLSNPAAALGLLRALEGAPEVVGSERVRGQPSTRYRVIVDLGRAADVLTGRAEELARALRRLRGRDDLVLEVWLDDEDRVTRLRYVLEPDLAGTRITLTTDLELHDFGLPVDIEPPQAGELMEVPVSRLRELDPLRRLRELLAPRR